MHFLISDLETNWSRFKNQQIRIEKLPSDPIPADSLIIEYADDTIMDQKANVDICRLLQSQLRHQVISKGLPIKLNFYNKTLTFTVSDIRFSRIYQEGHQAESTLEQQMKRLELHDKGDATKDDNKTEVNFFLITKKTKITISMPQDEIKSADSSHEKITTQDIGGLDEVIAKIREPMNIALGLQEVPAGLKIGRGLLLFGHTGCGKTMICEALANELEGVEVLKINASEIFSRYFGETERNLQREFEKAGEYFPSPCLIIIEDLNNLCPKHETNDVVKRVSAAFLNILDNLHLKPKFGKTFVLATSSNLDNLNPAARRCGRIDIEVEVNVPDSKGRHEILKKYLHKVGHILSERDILDIASVTHAFVGSDLVNLVSKAAALNQKENEKASAGGVSQDNRITVEHVNSALHYVKPSAMREVLIENPNVRWDDIGGQKDLKLKLKQAIEWPLLYPEKLRKLGIRPPRGILMFGPPGCSKTMIAKALATDSKVNFLSIKGPELFSMWVGESERAVRELFRKARQVAPSIIFFDEIDAIGGERSSDSGSSVKERVLAQILTELDGVDSLNNVTIVAATNRPDMIDKALMRPGRIDRIVYVPLPDSDTRREIFAIKLKTMPLDASVDKEELVRRTEGYSGAEIQAVCHEAALHALEENIDAEMIVWENFERALALVQPRTDSKLLKLYDDYLKQSLR